MATPNMHSILQEHVALTVSCIDRIDLNGDVPKLQTSGGLCYVRRDHLGYPIPSPALFRPMHDRCVRGVQDVAAGHQIPVVHFERGQRTDDIAAGDRSRFTAEEGVVVVGVAQERAISFKASEAHGVLGRFFNVSRQSVSVNHDDFYVQDRAWGPAFVKVGTYVPYPVRVRLNGHEWVKQQLRREGIGFASLDNGFLSCADPERLQAICDALGPDDVQAFFDRWVDRLPWPLTPADRAAGDDHRLAIWQRDVSLTQVFDRPVQGRHFFEELIRENLDLGRPDRVSLLFPTKLTRATPPPPDGDRTRVITSGVNPSLHLEHTHSHVKQYVKEERALRTETTINNPGDFYSRTSVDQLPDLRTAGVQVNRKLLEGERISHACTLTQEALDRLQRPTLEAGGRAPGVRFGDPRAMALFQALCHFAHLPQGFRNRDLRPLVASRLGLDDTTDTASRMTDDLRRLRLKGLIHRIPGTTRDTVTTDGLHVALFCSKVYLRILRPAWAALTPDPDNVPRPLRDALARLDTAIQDLYQAANVQNAAA